ncbi:MAG TPA: hypothetical protein VGR67_11280 [Candidatus Polarisedimenticolia bacterium]|jgi:hypothetical protein|nr:hypothetical protein [Candidatus Polarisedimenticolia bacterium]
MSRIGTTGTRFSWGRWALPVLLGLTLGAAVLQPIRSYDLGWQLAAGRLIVEARGIPATDVFSFTRAGTPWLDHEWLFQVIAYLLFRAGGWPALLALTLLLALAAYALMAWMLKQEGLGGGTLCLLLVLSIAGARFRFDARPEMVSLALLTVLFFALHTSRRSAGAIWLLPPVFLLWANVHPGGLLGAALMLLWLAGERLQSWRAPRPSREPGRLAIALLSPLLLLANPGGWRLLKIPFEIRSIVKSGHAPNLEWAPPAFAQFPLFYLSVIAGLVVLGAGIRRIDLPAALVALAAAVLAFQHLRNIGFFFLLLPIALARPAAFLEDRMRIPRRESRLLAATLLLLVAAHFFQANRLAARGGFLDPVEPRAAVDFIETRGIGGRLFNDVLFGGYLVWRRYPEHRVFIDGRNEIYDSLLAEIFDAVNDGEKWKLLMERYGIDAALLRRGQMQAVRYPPSVPGGAVTTELRAFSASHFPASQWALVYWDERALLFVRRNDPAARPLLQAEFRVNPDDIPHTLALLSRGDLDRREVLEEMDRKIGQEPDSPTALRLREMFRRVKVPGRENLMTGGVKAGLPS